MRNGQSYFDPKRVKVRSYPVAVESGEELARRALCRRDISGARRGQLRHHRDVRHRRRQHLSTIPSSRLTQRSHSMTHAIRFHKTGGPEVLVWEEVTLGKPGPGRGAHPPHRGRAELRRHLQPLRPLSRAIAERARRRGGRRGRGSRIRRHRSEARRPRRLWRAPIGAYAEARLIPADRLLKLPDGIDDKTAAAMMLKGLTTQYLIRQTYRVKAGDTILLHAAAGGVGLILEPMGQASRRHRDRHRRQRREGETRQGPWLRPHHRLYARGFREARRRDHRRQESAGGLRLRRQGHVPEIARLPGAARRRRAVRRSPPAASIRSTSACWRRRDRSTSPARRSTPMPPSAKTSSPWRTSCSTW